MRNKILFISLNQFGYFSIYYNYCEILCKEFDITYLCFDHGFPKQSIENVTVKYIELQTNKIKRQLNFYSNAVWFLRQNCFNVIIIKYFKLCLLYKLLNNKARIYLDIRTGYLNSNRIIRGLLNSTIKFEASFFDQILVLSASLSKRLRLPVSKTTVIPLGARETFINKKDFNPLRLLYIGVLTDRHLTDTIIGVNKYVKNNRNLLSYDIIGYGKPNEEKELRELISKSNLENIITFHGRIVGDNLRAFTEKCNVGMAYVPITEGYNVQPLTKLFEYLLSGMVVIATNTFENRRIISEHNGVLINDDPESISEALEKISYGGIGYNSDEIKKTARDYTWENIINNNLKPLLL